MFSKRNAWRNDNTKTTWRGFVTRVTKNIAHEHGNIGVRRSGIESRRLTPCTSIVNEFVCVWTKLVRVRWVRGQGHIQPNSVPADTPNASTARTFARPQPREDNHEQGPGQRHEKRNLHEAQHDKCIAFGFKHRVFHHIDSCFAPAAANCLSCPPAAQVSPLSPAPTPLTPP